jgi:hypothetical protein
VFPSLNFSIQRIKKVSHGSKGGGEEREGIGSRGEKWPKQYIHI